MKKLLLLYFLAAGFLFSQNYREFKTGFVSIFNNPVELNSYYFGGNPALLDFSSEDELLSVKNNINIKDGDFKPFIEPGSDILYELFASGKKEIDTNQRFSGSFGFQRAERKDWNWVYTRDYNNGNPFLIGDSTSGSSRINGIIMNAEYAINFSGKFSAGVSLDYSVDEMLKEISPKPTSVHRDIHSRIGINYRINEDINIGLLTDVFDKTERIVYREDEGSITQETIILKFKGYDYPNVFRKKTETRYSYINGYSAGVTFSYSIPKELVVLGYFLTGFDKTNIKDDATNPIAEGFWKNDFLEAGVKLSLSLREFTAGLTYKFHNDNGWGKYPPYNVLYFEKKNNKHSLLFGIQKQFNAVISAGIEGGIILNSINEYDHYSVVSTDSKMRTLFGKAGTNFNWNDNLSTLIAYGFANSTVPNYTYATNKMSDYYNLYRQYDVLYNITGYNSHEFTLTSKVDPGIGGFFLIHFNYLLIKPVEGSPFGSETRNRFDSVLEYRVKVF